MCHNHSHLVANLVEENTRLPLPALMFALARQDIRIESSRPGAGSLSLNTSGQLWVPSMMLGDSSADLPPQMAAGRMSLFFLPGGATTIIFRAVWDWMIASARSLAVSEDTALHLIATLRPEEDVDKDDL